LDHAGGGGLSRGTGLATLGASSCLLCAIPFADGNEFTCVGGSIVTIPEYIFAFLLVANAIGAFVGNARRLQDVERKLNLVLAHLGIDPTAQVNPSSDVINLAADPRQRIAAIRAYRLQSGAGLKEAVAVIDRIARGSGEAGT